MVGRIRFALERFDSPHHSSHVAQLFSLGAIAIPMFQHLKLLFSGKRAKLVYDARRRYRDYERKYKRGLMTEDFRERLRLYFRGELETKISEGRITRLFDQAPYRGEPRFEIDGDAPPHMRSFFCHGDISQYVVGRYAKVEVARICYPNQWDVTKVWISDEAA